MAVKHQSYEPTPQLPPESQARLERMAVTENVTPDQLLCDLVGVAWIRYCARHKLGSSEW